METNNQINPWLRANLETFNEETLSLIPEERRGEYAQVMARIAFAGEHLGNAFQAVQVAHRNVEYAHQVRDEFFASIQNGTAAEELPDMGTTAAA